MKRKILLTILILLIGIEAIISGWIYLSIKHVEKYNQQISLGDKYLEELDFGNAEICYKKAIEIDEKRGAPYLQLAVLYQKTDREQEALGILESGEKNNAYSEEIKEKVEEVKIEVDKKINQRKIYSEYREVVKACEKKAIKDDGSSEYVIEKPLFGISFLQLFDFNDDGIDELVICYYGNKTDGQSAYPGYILEIWGYENDSVHNYYQGDPLYTYDPWEYTSSLPDGNSVTYVTFQNKKLLKIGRAATGSVENSGYSQYLGFTEDNKFGVVYESSYVYYTQTNMYNEWKINEKKVTEDEWKKQENEWSADQVSYCFKPESTGGDQKEIEIISQKTKKMLGYEAEKNNNSEEDNQNSENTFMEEGKFKYSKGDLVSVFSINENNGKKNAEIGFWHNYGDSSSDEDFFFDWEDGTWEYEVLGNRSHKKFLLCFTPVTEGVSIQVTCLEGTYFAWETSQENVEWVNAKYTKQ